MRKTALLITIAAFLATPFTLSATELEYSNRKNSMEWFEGARFGVFIHWDARSAWTMEQSAFKNVDIRPEMKRNHEDAVWADEVDANGNPTGRKRWQTWDPSKFDADAWVELFVDAGARYFTFDAMHMFCQSNFDHPSSTFDIMSTPYGKDACAELARAADGKIVVMWYYNMYPSKHVTKERYDHFKTLLVDPKCSWDKFRADGIHELIRNTEKYGKVAGIWCDGGGSFQKNAINKTFYTKMKEVQPWLIFSPRCGHEKVPKDWKVPEQRMAPCNWETQQEMTMPIESDQWFWAGGKESNTKDTTYCIQTLTMTACRDANLLLNISPRGDGEIEPLQQAILRGVGKWLEANGEAIYETRGGPYDPGMWGGATRRGNKVYLHLLEISQDGQYTLPALPSKVTASRMLSGDEVTVRQTKDAVVVAIDPSLATDVTVPNRIVELTIADDAWEMLPNEVIPVEESKPLKVKATASSENTYDRPSGKAVTQAAANLLDGGHGGWSASEDWSRKGLDPNQWVALDLGKVTPVSRVFIQERHSRVQSYVLEYKDAKTGAWEEVISGARLNYLSYRFAQPVATQQVRLRFPKTEGGAAQLARFELYQ